MATDEKATPAGGGAEDGMLAHLSKMAWQALPAIASAISFVGFVAVVGAAIEWIRFDAANLPATQAMLALPRQELVAIGALALGTFVIGAVIAVLLVYLLDNKGNATEYTARGLVAVAVAEMLATLLFIGHQSVWTYVGLVIWLVLSGLIVAFVVSSVMRNFFSRSKLKRVGQAALSARPKLATAEDAQAAADLAAQGTTDAELLRHQAEAKGAARAAKLAYERSIKEWEERFDQVMERRDPRLRQEMDVSKEAVAKAPDALTLTLALENAERVAGHSLKAVRDRLYWRLRSKGPRSPTPVSRAWAASVLAVLVVLVGILPLALDSGLSWVLILLLVAGVLAMMNLFAARATEMFVWYGVSVFFSVLIFGASLMIARTLHEPQVQPVALMRKGEDVGICGVYITQTSDRVYVGRLPTVGKRPGEIFWVRTSDVDLVSVGQPEKIGQDKYKKRFSNYAEKLLERLYKDRAEEAAPTLKNTTISEEGKKPASKKQAKRIHGLHVVTNREEREVPPREVRSEPRPVVKIDGARCTATQQVEARKKAKAPGKP